MRKILKYGVFWLNKAAITLFILVLPLNMTIKEVNAAWSLFIGGDSLLGVNEPAPQKTVKVVLTAYSSTPEETDDTPFVTASNTRVRDGVVAANFLAFGTRVQIPAVFGDKVFVVEDRMAKKYNNKIDIWFPEKYLAKNFGVKEAEIVVLQ